MTYFCRDYYHNKLSSNIAFSNSGFTTLSEVTLPIGVWVINATMTARPTSLSVFSPYVILKLFVGSTGVAERLAIIENETNLEEPINISLIYVATITTPTTIYLKAINAINEITFALANGTWLTVRRLDEPKAAI